jgi:hypothetical protein
VSHEDWEIYRQRREDYRLTKLARLAEAESEFSRLREIARVGGLELTAPAERHWQVHGPSGELLVNYWPTTHKQQNGPNAAVRRRVRMSDFEHKLRLLCDQFSSE